MRTFALPNVNNLTNDAIRSWFCNIERELALDFLDTDERAYVRDYYTEAGLLTSWRRPYFFRHFAETIAAAARHLFVGKSAPRILDLGCGTGSQALLFALLGARVVGVDMDGKALGILEKRRALYEQIAQRRLDLEVVAGNAFEVDYTPRGLFDGVYSLFAFNMMQPSRELVDSLRPHLAAGSRWVVLDGNQSSYWCRLLPSHRRKVWTPLMMRRELEVSGFQIVSQIGGVAIPPMMWSIFPHRFIESLDRKLCSSLRFPISCQTLAVYDASGLGKKLYQ